MQLSIIIPTLPSRSHYLARLMRVLGPQLSGAVEVLTELDDGSKTTGAKRQAALMRAKGKYVCGLDDDDLPTADYVESILSALSFNPDCVGFWLERFVDGEPSFRAMHSLRCREYDQIAIPHVNELVYLRTPNHLNPIRTEIARKVGFPDITIAEDTAFAVGVMPLLKSEVFIDRTLYLYYWRSPELREKENAA